MSTPPVPPEVLAHYADGREVTRLLRSHNRIELLRTQEVLARHLPQPPAVVLDVGGGSGVYAGWLASRGYAVHLVDAVPLHVAEAARLPLASARVGDARRLDHPDASADGLLLLGPLYHLTERADRLAALAEARRALRPGGVLVAAGISRFASLFDGLVQGFLADPDFRAIVERDLAEGQHRNPTDRDYFTTAFFHRPEELAAEVAEAGLRVEAVLGVEGPAWLLADLDRRWDDAAERERVLWAARALEAEPSLAGLSAHHLAVATRP
jgi:SAM-dependent methyltransferase